MALSGQEHAVSGASQIEAELDGLATVCATEERLVRFCPSGFSPGRDLRDDGIRVFEPRILARNHAYISEPSGDRSLQRSLLDIALTSAPENHNQPTCGVKTAQQL